MTQITNLQQAYRVLVTATSDDYTNEWIGKVSLMPQENGDIYISITFTSEKEIQAAQAGLSAAQSHRLSIDSI